MEGKDQLLSKGAPPATMDEDGVDCPALIKQDMLAEEQSNIPETEKKPINEVDKPPKDVSFISSEKENRDGLPVNENVEIELHVEGKQTADAKEVLEGNYQNNHVVENVEQLRLDKEEEPGRDDASQGEQMIESKRDYKTMEEDNEPKVTADQEEIDGTDNNFVNPESQNDNSHSIDESEQKEGVRRTRFSSEIEIRPKAYFQAGTDTVVTLPPTSFSDDVFRTQMNDDSSYRRTNASPITLNAKPSQSNLNSDPPTFLPLSIFSCLFCCPMIGLFAVYRSFSVKKLIAQGDIRKAREASHHARQLGILTMLIGFLFVLAIIAIAILISSMV